MCTCGCASAEISADRVLIRRKIRPIWGNPEGNLRKSCWFENFMETFELIVRRWDGCKFFIGYKFKGSAPSSPRSLATMKHWKEVEDLSPFPVIVEGSCGSSYRRRDFRHSNFTRVEDLLLDSHSVCWTPWSCRNLEATRSGDCKSDSPCDTAPPKKRFDGTRNLAWRTIAGLHIAPCHVSRTNRRGRLIEHLRLVWGRIVRDIQMHACTLTCTGCRFNFHRTDLLNK